MSSVPPPVAPPEPPPAEETTAAYPRPGQVTDAELGALVGAVHRGTSWFYWIAGLSIVNSFLDAANAGFTFFIRLGITMIVDEVAHEMKSTLATVVAIVFAVVLGLIIVGLGALAQRLVRWAFVVGIGILAIDTLLLFPFLPGTFISIGFHVWALWAICNGYRAAGQLRKVPLAAVAPPDVVATVENETPAPTPAAPASPEDAVMEAPRPAAPKHDGH